MLDVVDFEVLLREGGDRGELRHDREKLAAALAGVRPRDEAARRQPP